MIDFEKLKEAYELLMKSERTLLLIMETLSTPALSPEYTLYVDKYSGDEGVLLFKDIDELIKILRNFAK